MMEDMALNYSRQDLELLVSEAERLVMPSRVGTNCGDHHDGSSDSDYETRASREWLVRSEPNISLRHHQGSASMVTSTPSEARRRPRRSVTRRPDWRLSLPECLEYYQPPGLTSDDGDHHDGRASQASLPLSDLWEHELMADNEEENDNEKAALVVTNLTNFGEDYSKYLYSETETSDSDIFSESDHDDVNNLVIRKSYSSFSLHNHRTQKSQAELKQLLIKTNPSHDSWKCEEELVSI